MSLPMPVAVGVWVVVGVLLLLVVLTGRRRLAQRTGRLVPAPPTAPSADDLGPAVLGPLEATYVCTTLAGDWLARVGAYGLGDRSAAQVSVHDAGVLVRRAGADDLLVPADTLRGVGLAPGMAGKYVGADGLVVLTWLAPSDGRVRAVELDTGLRTRHPADKTRLVEAVRRMVAAPDETTPNHPKETP